MTTEKYDELGVVLVRWDSNDPGINTVVFDRQRPEIYYALLDWARRPEQRDAQRRRDQRVQDTLRKILGDDYHPGA